MIRTVALALGLTLFSGSTVWAIPQTLNFQGLLKESGSPVNDTRQMTFKIWDSPSGGSAVFTEPASGTTDVIVSTGVFSFTIGSIISGGIPLSVFDGSDRYVEVVVGTTTLPRQKITSVGNAFIAATAVNLSTSAAIQISSLDVSGSAQFGAGAVKSTFSTTGDLTLASNADLTLTGPTAYATFPASVTASAFFGDGSHLTGLASTDKYVKLLGSAILTSDADEGASAAKNCVAGSSVTATSSACKIKVVVTGSVRGNTGGAECYLAVLQDGGWLPGWTASKPMTYSRTVGGAEYLYTPAIINYTGRTATTAASHTWCIALWTGGSGPTCTLESGEANTNFEIWEVCD